MSDKDTVALFVPRLSTQDGMGQGAMLSIAALRRLGKHPRVFCFSADEQESNVTTIPTAQDLILQNRCADLFAAPHDTRLFFDLVSRYARSGDMLSCLPHALISLRIVDSLRMNHIIYYHVGTFDTFALAARYCKANYKSRLIVQYHGLPPPGYLDGFMAKVYQRAAFILLRQLMGDADAVIVHSKFSSKEFESYFGVKPTHIIPLGIDLNKFRRRREKEEAKARLGLSGRMILLYVGRLVGYKRVSFLIESMRVLRKAFPNIFLLVIGTGNHLRYIEIAHKAGVRNYVSILGPLNNIIPYYEAADIFVSASLHEGFCLPVVEAQAFGIPSVVPRIGAFPEIVGNGGLLFEPFNAKEFTDRVIELLTDSGKYALMQENALSYSYAKDKEITISRIAEVMSNI